VGRFNQSIKSSPNQALSELGIREDQFLIKAGNKANVDYMLVSTYSLMMIDYIDTGKDNLIYHQHHPKNSNNFGCNHNTKPQVARQTCTAKREEKEQLQSLVKILAAEVAELKQKVEEPHQPAESEATSPRKKRKRSGVPDDTSK